jgi:hypothetical protein
MTDPVPALVGKFLKALPLWMFTATLLSSAAIWSASFFLALFPTSIQVSALGAGIVSGAFAACKSVSLMLARRRVAAADERRTFVRLYRPLYRLFLRGHPKIDRSRGPDLRERVENALDALRTSRSLRRGTKMAFRALFYQPPRRAVYNEGDRLPIKAIEQLAVKYAYADTRLLDLITLTYESYYDEPRTDELTDAELALYDHIIRKHDPVSERFA